MPDADHPRDYYPMHDHGYGRHSHHVVQGHAGDVTNPRANDHSGLPRVTQQEADRPGTQRTVSGAEGPPPSVPLGVPKPVAAAVPTPPPTGPAILGRAWVDDSRTVWWPDGVHPDGTQWWRMANGTTDGTTEMLVECYGGREVLLVDPRVGQCLAELRRWVRDWEAGSEPDDQALVAAAVDALPDAGTDTPTPAGEVSAQATPGVEQDIAPDTTPEDELADGKRALYDHVVGAHGPSDVEPGPEPAGGPSEPQQGAYWERAVIGRFVDGGEVRLATVRAQVDALLADRDGLRRLADGLWGQVDEVARERNAARAELAERTRERDYSDAALEAAARDMAQMTADRDRLERELVQLRAELEYVRADREGLDLQRNRLLAERATARRDAEQAASRGATELAQVTASRSHWMAVVELIEAGRHPIAEHIRRNAAADALEEAANDASVLLESGARVFTARGLRARADIIRADGRPVPGSPEPAPAGGEETHHA